MDLFFQFGFGMMKFCREFQRETHESTTILSPRDLEPEQLIKFGNWLKKSGGKTLIDPQFFLPRSDHHRLISHKYWPSEYDTTGFSEFGMSEMADELINLNDEIGTESIIIPGERAIAIDDIWVESQNRFFEEVRSKTSKPLIATLCLSGDVVRSDEQISRLLDEFLDLEVEGFYLIFEHPDSSYFVEDPIWLANSLDITASIFLSGKKSIIGYSNQQNLIYGCAGATAIASGNWSNVRSFPIDKFMQSDEEGTRKKAIWYYFPQAYTDIKINFLDLAVRRYDIVEQLRSKPNTPFSNLLFDAPLPSSSGWNLSIAFSHYISALMLQTRGFTKSSYSETLSSYKDSLEDARSILEYLHTKRITGQNRDFLDIIDIQLAAILQLESIFGGRLERNWVA